MANEPRTAGADGEVRLSLRDGIAALVFDRHAARNAMTWSMYEQLAAHCERLASMAGEVRAVTMRGAGGKAFVAGTDIAQFAGFQGAGGEAFVAGTDIAQFQDFKSGEDGVQYERQIDATISLIASLPKASG